MAQSDDEIRREHTALLGEKIKTFDERLLDFSIWLGTNNEKIGYSEVATSNILVTLTNLRNVAKKLGLETYEVDKPDDERGLHRTTSYNWKGITKMLSADELKFTKSIETGPVTTALYTASQIMRSEYKNENGELIDPTLGELIRDFVMTLAERRNGPNQK